jgi:hypothetical protein
LQRKKEIIHTDTTKRTRIQGGKVTVKGLKKTNKNKKKQQYLLHGNKNRRIKK